MNDYARIATKLTTTVWAITPESLSVILRIAESHMAGEKFEPSAEQRHYFESRSRSANFGEGEKPYSTKGGIGILPIAGPIFGKANMMTEMSGATSLEASRSVFNMMMADDEIHTILMDIDSPGGSTDLLTEFAQEIFDARSQKPIYAIANTAANSAAYYLGSQADRMYVTPSGQVGSIGTYVVHEDQSRADEMQGKKFTYVSAGPNKTEGNPHEPLSYAAEQHMQAFVNEFYGQFVDAVARGRNTTAQTVEQNMGGGRVLSPRMALEAGAVDGILPYDALVSQLAKGPSRPVTVHIPGGAQVAAMIQGNQVYALENKFADTADTIPEEDRANTTILGRGSTGGLVIASWLIGDLAGKAESKELEHSEPGTGSPPAPRLDEDGSDDIAIKEGWRRNPLPLPTGDPHVESPHGGHVNHNANADNINNDDEGGEKKVDLTQEQFEQLCNALGVQPSQFFTEAKSAFGEITALRAASAQISEEERLRKEFPDFYKQFVDGQEDTRKANAATFVSGIKMFKTPQGNDGTMVETGFGLSAHAINTITEVHKKFSAGTADVADFEQAISAVADGGTVDYREQGSSRKPDTDDLPDWNTHSVVGLANARKAFAALIHEVQAEKPELTYQQALIEAGKRQPDLAAAYRTTKPVESGVA